MECNYFIHFNIDAGGHKMEGNCVMSLNKPISEETHIAFIQNEIKEDIEPKVFVELGKEVNVKVIVDNFIQLPN